MHARNFHTTLTLLTHAPTPIGETDKGPVTGTPNTIVDTAQRLDILKHSVFEKLGFKRMLSETSVYYTLPSSDLGLTLIVTIVDDFVLIARDRAAIAEIKRRLKSAWTIVDKGPIEWVLNTKVTRDRPAGILKIDQSA